MMPYFQIKLYAFFMALFVMQTGFTQAVSTTQISLSSYSPVAPVIKSVDHNPVLRIRAYVPANFQETYLSSIRATLNEPAISSIEKIEVFSTGSEPSFSADSMLGSITPSSTNLELPFRKVLQAGLNYLWFSITLKDNADPATSITFHAKSFTTSSGRTIPVSQEEGEYNKRIAIAVRKAGDDQVHTYRIPGIITTEKQTLIAVYDIRYKGSNDLPGNIDVGMSRSVDGGKSWSPMKVIIDMGAPHENNGAGDPSILFDPVTKKIWVSALWSKGNRSIAGSRPGLTPDETGQFVVVSSSDDGLSWTEPISITPQVKNPSWHIFFPGPGNGISMKDGKIVFPTQYWDSTHMPHSTLVYSADHGQTWKAGTGAKKNTTESQLVETTPGTIMLNMRDNRGGFRSVATTTSLGKEWLEHPTSYLALKDPVCMASFIKANVLVAGKMKEVLFFSNASSSTARVDITVRASLDLGESWKASNSLLVDERKTYGYSALTRVNKDTIGLLYEGIGDLYFVLIPVNEIVK